MSRPTARKPSYCLHKPSGRTYATINGKPVYFGRHGTPESRDRYDLAIAEWIATGRSAAVAKPDDASKGSTVSHIVHAFWARVQRSGVSVRS